MCWLGSCLKPALSLPKQKQLAGTLSPPAPELRVGRHLQGAERMRAVLDLSAPCAPHELALLPTLRASRLRGFCTPHFPCLLHCPPSSPDCPSERVSSIFSFWKSPLITCSPLPRCLLYPSVGLFTAGR